MSMPSNMFGPEMTFSLPDTPGGPEIFLVNKERIDDLPIPDYINFLEERMNAGDKPQVELLKVRTRLEALAKTLTQANFDTEMAQIRPLYNKVEALLQRISTPLQPAQPDAGPQQAPPPREGVLNHEMAQAVNPYQEFLISKGMPIDKVRDFSERGLQFQRSFALTTFLQGVKANDWPNMVSYNPGSFSYSSPRFPEMKVIKLIESAANNIPPGPERTLIEKIIGKEGAGGLRTDVLIIEEFFDLFAGIKKATAEGTTQQSASAMREVYAKLRQLNLVDGPRIGCWHALPKLLKEDMLTEEAVSLGDLFFLTFKEILRTGRVWEPDAQVPGWIRPKLTPMTVKVIDPKHLNSDAYLDPVHHTPLSLLIESFPKPAVREDDQSLFPEADAGGAADVKAKAIYRLRVLASKAARGLGRQVYIDEANRGTSVYPAELAANGSTVSADVATLLAYHLSVLCGEADFQDNINGRTVGKNIFARLLHALEYSQKTNSGAASESKTSWVILGRVLAYVRSFFKFASTADGKTFEQAVMTSNSWGNINISTWPDSMTQRWADHVLQGFGEYERGEGGLRSGSIFKIAEINFTEGRVQINQAILKDLHDALRFSWEYYVNRDMVPGAVFDNWPRMIQKLKSKPGGAERTKISEPIDPTAYLPSEEFSMVTVGDSAGNIVYGNANKDPFITRMPKSVYVSPIRLGRWVQASTGIKNRGNDKGKGYEVSNTKVVKHRVLDAQGHPTGQEWKEIVIKLKPGVDAAVNTPELLSRRLLTEYVIALLAMQGDVIPRLEPKDAIALGMFLSKEMRDRFLAGDYGGLGILVSSAMAEQIKHIIHGELGHMAAEFMAREDPRIYGLDLLSQDQYFEMLDAMGHKISGEDFKHVFEATSAAIGFAGSSGAKH